MKLVRRIGLPLRTLLVLALLAMLVLQFFSFPGKFRYEMKQGNISETERWLFTALVGGIILCFEVIIVCTWMLLSRVLEDEIFRPGSLRWVDGILVAMAAAWVLVAVPIASTVPQWDDPGGPFVMTILLVAGAVVGLLMSVLRALLQQATQLRSDMDAVI